MPHGLSFSRRCCGSSTASFAGFLLKQAGLKRTTADTGAVTLIQRFGSAANLNIHLHCLELDGVYRRTGGEPVFQEARAPTGEELQGLLEKTIVLLIKKLTRPHACAPGVSVRRSQAIRVE